MQIITIITWRGEEITGTVRETRWGKLIITPVEPDFCEWHLLKSDIRYWNGEEY